MPNIRTDTPWQLWRTYCGLEALSGCYHRKVEAEKAVIQLKKLYKESEFKIVYAGANISHCAEGGRSL